MLKQSMLILAAAGLISIAAPFATAQSNDQQSQPMQDNGGRHHGPPDPVERTKELTKHLKLTSDQQTKVQSALESQRSQMESLHQDSFSFPAGSPQQDDGDSQEHRRPDPRAPRL